MAGPSSRLDFDLSNGQSVGLLGKNGAGKSTLIDLVLGFRCHQRNAARVWREERCGCRQPTRRRIGFVPQTDELMDADDREHLALIASFLNAGTTRRDRAPGARLGSAAGSAHRDHAFRWRAAETSTLMALGHRPPCW